MFERNDLSAPQRTNSNGYVELSLPSHPNARDGWVLKHRCVMENRIGRYLTADEVVHHVNEIKTCNEIWNLFLTTEEEHTFLHRLGKRHKRSSTASMSRKHKKIAQGRQRDAGGKFVAKPPRDEL